MPITGVPPDPFMEESQIYAAEAGLPAEVYGYPSALEEVAVYSNGGYAPPSVLPTVMPVVMPSALPAVIPTVMPAVAPTMATPMALPAVAGIIAALPKIAGATLTLGFLKALLAKYGPYLLKMMVGGAVFATIVKLITGGASDETLVKIKRARKRYSIGANPRLNTLLKVGKRVDNIFNRYDKRIGKFRSRLRGTRPRRTAPFREFLSPVERRVAARR